MSLVLALLLTVLPGPAPGSTRESRPFALSLAITPLGLLPLVGVDLSYHLIDRVAVGVQLMSLGFVYDASAYLRFVALALPESGLFVEAIVHDLTTITAEDNWGGGGAIGCEFRLPGGFTAALSAGALALRHSCEFCGAAIEGRWTIVPTGSVRVGYAFRGR